MADPRDPIFDVVKSPDGDRVVVETMPHTAPIMMNVRPVPVAEWPKKPGQRVLLWVAYDASIPGGWPCIGHWSEASQCWIREGLGGIVTHVAPLPPKPEGA